MSTLPDDVRQFLHQNIESVEQLEVLPLLWRTPERVWTSDEVATAVYSHPSSVVRRLAVLLGQGLLRERESGCYQYAPRTADLHHTVTRRGRSPTRFVSAGRRGRTEMAAAVYVLRALTSLACAVLLLRGYQARGVRLLLWSGLAFIGFARGNFMLVIDRLVVGPESTSPSGGACRSWRDSWC